MSNYLSFAEKQIENNPEVITAHYEQGYLFTRKSKGNVYQTRSLRIKLDEFEPSSENRRILAKFPQLSFESQPLPISDGKYDWHIHKLGKYFYTKKFADHIFSAAKIRTLLTDESGSNFNLLLAYKIENQVAGYVICYRNEQLLHYCYPFYEFEKFPPNLGMAMMLNAILWAKQQKLSYFYVGSVKDESDKYKLQFKGLEWFDGNKWNTDLNQLKLLLN